jgi:hypothetical protein
MASRRVPEIAAALIVLAIALFVPVRTCRAQTAPPSTEPSYFAADDVNLGALPLFGPDRDAVPSAPPAATPRAAASSLDDEWHISVSPYVWFPGMFGTVGAFDRELSVHATPGDLLSNFRFGLMGLVELRRNRLVLPVDFIWVRLGDNKPVPLESFVTTANLKAQEFILTPKVGVRLLGTQRMRIDAMAGLRYWHLGSSFSFKPSFLGLNFSPSENWVDPIVGGRIQGSLSSKLLVTVAGNVGGWGTGSQLDYEVVGLLGYRIKPAVTLQAGYRYLAVDYRSEGFLFNVFTPGAVLGVTIAVK